MTTSNPPPRIACPHCQAMIKSPALAPGSQVTCPKCSQAFRLEGRPRAAPLQPEQPPPGPLPRAHGGSRGIANPPAPPRVPPAHNDLVPLEQAAAALATQPAHRPPTPAKPPASGRENQTIDPLMLGPQPRPKPAPAKEVAIVCKLCGTRMYAPLGKIGQTMACPDCHTVNEIVGPKKPTPSKATVPTLDDAPDFDLSDPGDRPAYRPLVATRGEYAALADFDPAQRPPGWSRPEGPATAVAAGRDEDDDDVEITIAAPVERIELKPEIKPLPPPDPEDSMYDGKYDDGLIGDRVDRSTFEAWKKAPLTIGILGFLVYTSTIPRLIMYAIGLMVAVNLGHQAIANATREDSSSQVLVIFLSGWTAISFGLWIASFAAVLLAVVQDTANGIDDVASYPDWNIVEWVLTAAYFPVAAFVAALPGAVFTVLLVGIGLDTRMGAFAAGAPLVISWIVLFPVVLYSMLAEGSIMAPYSPATYKSLQEASEGWVFFYMYAVLLGVLGTTSVALAASPFFIANGFGCLGVVVIALLYCRVLGRTMWYASEKMARLDRQAESNA